MKSKIFEAYYLLYYFQEYKPSISQIKSFVRTTNSLSFQKNILTKLLLIFPKLFFLIDGSLNILRKRNDFNKKILAAMYITEFTKKNYRISSYSSQSIFKIMYYLITSSFSKIFSIILGSLLLLIFFKK